MRSRRTNSRILGAPVFVKGHLRRYATLLGLPEDEILGAYERSKQHMAEPSLVPKSRLEMMPERGRPKWPWVLGGAVAFLVAAAGRRLHFGEWAALGRWREDPVAAEPARTRRTAPSPRDDAGAAGNVADASRPSTPTPAGSDAGTPARIGRR